MDNAVDSLEVVLVLFQLFDDVSWHGDVKCLIVVVPFQFYTAI